MNGNKLVKKARAGDKQAFATLYISYKDSLYRYAYYKLRSAEDAKDAVSACITQAYMGIASIRDEKAFSAWLFRILYRECCAIIRRKAQITFAEIDENRYVVPDDTYIRSELTAMWFRTILISAANSARRLTALRQRTGISFCSRSLRATAVRR